MIPLLKYGSSALFKRLANLQGCLTGDTLPPLIQGGIVYESTELIWPVFEELIRLPMKAVPMCWKSGACIFNENNSNGTMEREGL